MENVRWVIKEVLDALNNYREMVGVIQALDGLNRKELKQLDEALTVLITKTRDEIFILRMMSLKNQVAMSLCRQITV